MCSGAIFGRRYTNNLSVIAAKYEDTVNDDVDGGGHTGRTRDGERVFARLILIVRNFIPQFTSAHARLDQRRVAGSEVIAEVVARRDAERCNAICSGAHGDVGGGSVGARLHILFEPFFADYVAGELRLPSCWSLQTALRLKSSSGRTA